VLVVDDAHWADPPSLRWLGYLARRLEGLPVLALIAVRSGEPPSEPRLLDDLLAEPRALCCARRPLGLDASAAVVRGRIVTRRPSSARPAMTPPAATRSCSSTGRLGAGRGAARMRARRRDRAVRPRGGGARAGPPARAAGARGLARAVAVLGTMRRTRVAPLAGLEAAEAAR
jgi:hypothetical protein